MVDCEHFFSDLPVKWHFVMLWAPQTKFHSGRCIGVEAEISKP